MALGGVSSSQTARTGTTQSRATYKAPQRSGSAGVSRRAKPKVNTNNKARASVPKLQLLPQDMSTGVPMPFPMDGPSFVPRRNKYGANMQTFGGVVGSLPQRVSSRGTTLKPRKQAVGRRLPKVMSSVALRPTQLASPVAASSSPSARQRHEQWINQRLMQQKGTSKAERASSSTDMLQTMDHERVDYAPRGPPALEEVEDGEEFLDYNPMLAKDYVPVYTYNVKQPRPSYSPSKEQRDFDDRRRHLHRRAPFATDLQPKPARQWQDPLLGPDGKPLNRRQQGAFQRKLEPRRKAAPFHHTLHDKAAYFSVR
eukprot:CAMPEP_0175139646 /NCGR_PEP_ID=MMETSP0087-20121206/11026_1 /TAXON_ID=136419 /ORGANISM="Unknown Unknown, Strain D1" /LENGTH=311 /DNA_ID=CAMNT_0016422695 /DNA_START=79 /DNA_END=1014 /DNA_ORIENTATION=-